MVADVRLKIRMRLRATLAAIQTDARPGGVLLQIFEVAKTNHVAADAVQTHYRTWVANEFPGCTIEYGRKFIYVYLPDSYGAGRAPIMEQLPIALVPVFHPIREVKP